MCMYMCSSALQREPQKAAATGIQKKPKWNSQRRKNQNKRKKLNNFQVMSISLFSAAQMPQKSQFFFIIGKVHTQK